MNIAKTFKTLGSGLSAIKEIPWVFRNSTTALTAFSQATGIATTTITAFFGAFAAAAVIGATIGLLDYFTTSGKEAAKASDEAAKAFEDSVNTVSGLKKQLQDVNDKIDAINSKDSLSPVDAEELAKLEKQQQLLERDLATEQKIYKIRQKQNATAASEALKQNGSESLDWRHVTDNDLSRLGITDDDRKQAGWEYDPRPGAHMWEYNLAQETAAMQNAYDRYIEEQNALRQKLSDNGSLTKEEAKQQKQLNEYTKKLEAAISDNVEELQTYRERLTNSAGNALRGHEDEVFQIDQVLDQFNNIERDPFEDLANHWKELQRLGKDNAGLQTSEMRHFLEVMSGKDMSTASLDELIKTWDKFKNLDTIDFSKMFTGDTETNLQNFWKMVEKIDSEWAKFDEKTQTWTFNIESVDELAKKLGISKELVENIIKLTNKAGANIEVQNKDLNGQKVMESSKAEKTLKKSGVIDKSYKIDVQTNDLESIEKQINDVSASVEKLKGKDGKINIDSKEGQAAYSIISQLYDRMIELSMQNSVAFHLDTSEIDDGSTKAQQVAKDIHDASVAIAEYQAALNKSEYNPKINVEEFEKKAKEACDKAASSLKTLEENSPDLAEKLSITPDQLDFSAVSTALGNAVDPNLILGQIQASITGMTQDDFELHLGVDPEAIENYKARDDHETTVHLDVDDAELEAIKQKNHEIKGTLKVDKSALSGLSTTVAVRFRDGGKTEHRNGGGDFLQGTAHAGGNWGTQKAETALTGERGREIVVLKPPYMVTCMTNII